MIVIIKILQFVLSLSIIVIVHEFGHFLFAKLFKTRVEKFYLFFDPWFSIFKIKRGDTEYGVGWLPLGGYVKISGMIDESMDKEQMKQPPRPYEFRSKPAWQRLLIMIGGVLFNFVLAVLLYVMVLFTWGKTYLPTANVKYGIVTDSTGHALGLMNGDRIVSIDGNHIEDFYEIRQDIVLNERKNLRVEREGRLVDIPINNDYIRSVIKGSGRIEVKIPNNPLIIEDFQKVSPAREAGIMKGDLLRGIDGVTFDYVDEYKDYLSERRNTEIVINITRDGEEMDIPLVTTADAMIGVVRNIPAASDLFEFEVVRYSFFQSFPAGIAMGVETMQNYLKQFKIIFSKDTKAYESLGGFITIGSIFPGVWDWQAFWNLTAFLSIILGIMNILPIPALDGGHVLFLIFEVVTGRKPSDKFLEYAQITGMILLLALLIFANGNDIIRLIRK